MKNLSEYALCFTTQDWLILHSKDISSDNTIDDETQKIINHCHIYMIHTRPLVCFVKDSISYDNEKNILGGKLKVSLPNDKFKESNFSFYFPLVDDAVSIKCEHPYKKITTHNQSGDIVRYIPAYEIVPEIEDNDLINELLNLKIEYIGQAYGNSARSAFDRLKNHSTFQKILAEIPYNNPNLEVWISLVRFQEPRLITYIDGRGVKSFDEKIESKRLRDIISSPLSKKEQVNLIEAGLIRYFQPNYNVNLKYSFPSAKQQMLSKLSNIDISGLIVEFYESDYGFRVYSDLVIAKRVHLAQYDLTTNKNRTSFFNRTIQVTNADEVIKMTKK